MNKVVQGCFILGCCLILAACQRPAPKSALRDTTPKVKTAAPAKQYPQSMMLFRNIMQNPFKRKLFDGRYESEKDYAPPPRDVSHIPNAVPKYEPKSRYGNPSSYKVLGKKYHVLSSSKGYKERGLASWYGSKFHNHRTSSGEPYNVYGMSAAHRSLPLPTYARVTNLENGKQVIVKVNDRGPFHQNRVLDLSYAAAKKLGIYEIGTGLVEVEAIDIKNPGTSHPVISSSHRLFVQVGAFSELKNASRFAQKVADATGHEVQLMQISLKNKSVYRVLVGPVKTAAESDVLARLIQKKGFGVPITIIQ